VLSLSYFWGEPRGGVSIGQRASGGRGVGVQKVSKRRVEVRGGVRGSRDREELNSFGKKAVAVDRFQIAARDENFGFCWCRKIERDEDSIVVRGEGRGGVGVKDGFV